MYEQWNWGTKNDICSASESFDANNVSSRTQR